MSEQDQANQSKDEINDFYLPDEMQIKQLRSIIRAETSFKFTYKDAEEVGYQLISLYECLAKGRPIVAKGGRHESRE